MRFAKLDLEMDPELQGFEKGTYDVIMYVMYLFATENLPPIYHTTQASLFLGIGTH